MRCVACVNENRKLKRIYVSSGDVKPVKLQQLQKSNHGYKKVRTCGLFSDPYNENHRQAMVPAETKHIKQEVRIMALSNIAGWTENTAGSACGASDKPAACGASEKPAACGSACGAGDKPAETPAACGAADKPEEKPAACGSACGAGDK